MANVTIEEIEDVIITAIENQCKKGVVIGGYVRTVETYGGQFEDALEALITKTPLILVEFERFDNQTLAARGTSAQVYRRNMIFNIFVADQNLRGEKEARRGSTGTYQMIEDVSIALCGQQLGLAIGGLDLERAYRIANLKRFSVYQMIFKTFSKYGI